MFYHQHLQMFGLKFKTICGSNFHCEPQIQVGDNLNKITQLAKGYIECSVKLKLVPVLVV